jgi:hypothetical protein
MRRGSKPAAIRDSWDAIVSHLTRLRRPIAGMLQPPLAPERIAKLTRPLPFPLGRELLALYSVTNGTPVTHRRPLSDVWIFPGYYLLSLEEAIAEYRSMRRAPQWEATWFPVLADNAGDYYVVGCGRGASRGVRNFLRGEPEHDVEYTSISAMLETFAECFAKGAFFVRRGALDVDDDAHARIARRLNPGLAAMHEEKDHEAEQSARGRELADRAQRLLLRDKKPLAALAAYEKAMGVRDFDPSFYVNALYALNLANAKRRLDRARVRRVLERVLSRRNLHPDTFWNAACTWIALGETDACIGALREAKRRGVDMRKCLADTEFAPLAGDPRFIALKRASR